MKRPEQVHMLILILIVYCRIICGIQIPKDVEILEGYEFDDSVEYYGADFSHLNNREMLQQDLQNKVIRNKRSSDELNEAKALNIQKNLNKKKLEKNQLHKVDKDRIELYKPPNIENGAGKMNNEKNASKSELGVELLPKPEKQIMDPDYDYYSQRHLASWKDAGTNVKPDSDVVADSSTNYNGRHARVNFITQPRKENDPAKAFPAPPVLTKTTEDFFKPRYDSKFVPMAPIYNYEMHPSRSYDPYLRRYDRYDEHNYHYDRHNYEDHFLHRRHYDPYDSYSPRKPRYPESYYNYPNRHYDVPELREYVSMYNNDVYDKRSYDPATYTDSYMAGTTYLNRYPRNFRRIVYYAHLPEIVRTRSPMYDSTHSKNQYDYDYANDGAYRGGLLSTHKPISGIYKMDKPSGITLTASSTTATTKNLNSDNHYSEYLKRDKKDHLKSGKLSQNS